MRFSPLMSSKHFFRLSFVFFTALFSVASFVLAEVEETVTSEKKGHDWLEKLESRVHDFKLSNGMQVVLYQRDFAPIFSGHIWVKVGGVDEVPGISGLSHFLEHMAFKGSTTVGTKSFTKEKPLLDDLEEKGEKLDALRRKRSRLLESLSGKAVKDENSALKNLSEKIRQLETEFSEVQKELEDIWEPNEFSRIYKKKGAVGLNAGTSNDYTVYTVSLPKNAFETWLWMESDRLKNPVFRQFYKEREVIQEERRSRVDDNPGGKLYEALIATAFWSHPSRLPVIGWPSDMRNLSLKQTRELYETYYRPDNIVISLAGDLEVEEVKAGLEKYFGDMPQVDEPLPEVYTEEEPQEGERKSIVLFDAKPQMMMAWHKPNWPNPEDAQFSVLHSVLAEGRSSVLYKELVQERKLASSINTYEAPGQRFPQLFIISGRPVPGVSNETLAAEVEKILQRIASNGISDERLKAAKRRVRLDYLSSLSSNSGMARALGNAQLIWDDWRAVAKVYDIILETESSDVQRLISKYLVRSNRTLAFLETKKDK